jgi:hypothetical protein
LKIYFIFRISNPLTKPSNDFEGEFSFKMQVNFQNGNKKRTINIDISNER